MPDPAEQLDTFREALKRIARYDEEPLWADDRDDAADDMLAIARAALGGEGLRA